ncbi:hypothetical protein POP12_111 [Pectobacterium phage POP12]|nr:hypothetical protein POP12_111 [Pectobacterium phage POP12]
MVIYQSRNYKQEDVKRVYIKYLTQKVTDTEYKHVLVRDEVNEKGLTIKTEYAEEKDYFPESVSVAYDLRGQAYNSVRVK